ncbi:MAG: hypothetical protein J5616_02310 [Bacteroidaceae bacterium]|nr:hypothetical protein [Bacteroidaceae bacterium]
MKKFLITVVAFASLFLAACTSNTPVDKAVSLIEEATEKMEKAESLDDLESFSQEFETKFAALEKEAEDYEPTKEEEERVQKALEKFQEVAQKKAEEFVSGMLGGDDEEDEEEE